MKLNIGDKVKFLNQSGGGVVTKIVSSQMVCVTDNDGFEIPTLVNELVKIDAEIKSAKMFHNEADFPKEETLQKISEQLEEETSEFETITPLRKAFNNPMKEGVYLAFVPHEQRWLLTGNVDIYLLNFTKYDLIFSLFLSDIETENFIGQDYSSIPKHSKIFLETIGRDGIPQWSKGVVQALFHTNEDSRVLNPLNVDFKINGMRFLKEESYKMVPVLGEKALVVNLGEISTMGDFLKSSSAKEKDKAGTQGKSSLLKEEFSDRQLIGKNHAEIDLHIDELADDTASLSPEEMLKIQLRHFEKALDAAIENHLEKITFIHGVGSGKLKSEIAGILKQYEGLHWFDAPMSKYGVGATEVLIGQNPVKNI